jgi:uncharacterized protein
VEVIEVRPRTGRLVGPDVVRAVAMAGVVIMNFHGYLILRGGQREGGWADDLFDPWVGPLATRFAATFVLTAGVGVTLLTRSAAGNSARTNELRWILARRGLILYGFGMVSTSSGRGRSCRTTAPCSCSPPHSSRFGRGG